MTAVTAPLAFLVCLSITGTVSAIECYNCDNSKSYACGPNFRAYQFDPVSCYDKNAKCGKQEQLPDKNGWVGVIRSCYTPGELWGMNETNGCHYYTHPVYNFTALYCFCDTPFCNSAPPTAVSHALLVLIWVCLCGFSALSVF